MLKSFYKILTTLKTKHNCPCTVTNRYCGANAVMSGFSVFPYRGKKRYFSCSPLSIALCNGVSICEYKVYWHMNLLLINGAVSCAFQTRLAPRHTFWEVHKRYLGASLGAELYCRCPTLYRRFRWGTKLINTQEFLITLSGERENILPP